jgi:hypothetical protein
MKKRTNRKRWALIDPIAHGISGAGITSRESLNKLRMAEYAALDAMTKGSGTVDDWHTLVGVMNISEVMGKSGIGPEVLPVCEEVQRSLAKSAERFKATGRMGLDGLGIKALRDLLEYADLQQSSISRGELEKFIVKTKNYLISRPKNVVEVIKEGL